MAMTVDHERDDGFDRHLHIGTLIYDDIDQIDVTGPFEVLPRLPNATHHLYAPTDLLVRDIKGLRIQADATIADAPQIDVLHVPGGPGQEALMDDRSCSTGFAHRQPARRLFCPSARGRRCLELPD